MRPVFSVALALTLLVPLASSAQGIPTVGNTEPFTLSVDPQYPVPFSEVFLSATSSSVDLTNAVMTVTVAGEQLYRGSVQPTKIKLGRAGSITRVTVTMTINGASTVQSVSIVPQDVALAVEPVASAPPLYPGKPLVPLEGDTRIVAVANFRTLGGAALNPAALSYAWTVDDTRIANSSGIGKSAVLVASPIQYRARTVSVAITSQDGTLVGGDSISLSPQSPSVRVYENDPLLGILFNRALLGTYAVAGAESTLYAAPFSVPLKNGAPLIQWFLNGSPAQTGGSITLRPSGSGQGSASLSLTASSGNQIHTAANNLLLTFGAAASTNFFGL